MVFRINFPTFWRLGLALLIQMFKEDNQTLVRTGKVQRSQLCMRGNGTRGEFENTGRNGFPPFLQKSSLLRPMDDRQGMPLKHRKT